MSEETFQQFEEISQRLAKIERGLADVQAQLEVHNSNPSTFMRITALEDALIDLDSQVGVHLGADKKHSNHMSVVRNIRREVMLESQS